ncbi:symmetrical bis(5'-nucleosyl)-tetraphosphatase [endosymbiont of unidentified scaly snail isolate Monju]|uniref:symmetrical bis(5'-nucleosyl)-tetraphosphatase n=1 Tax=endosymbiont of unidentified scaly snail isolate Monju TaxID=1248727 RepID=UPI0003892C0B|nr:symmetrical bis(5'-nucleosyl)-tetraphosphatase [endosymbiont of unidentified scaly snail isolate Monju]BAN68332.1 bis(5'-nucleosyl)-tetraphosphatase (symmetrical) [endosymbiont of unidentified scaly snail isolate Monju]
MAVYAVGDVQGCYDALRAALDGVSFDPARDRLWFVGDLVNRGPQSLEVLRFVHGLGKAATVVLGNHDLHLLALAAGHGLPGDKDHLDEVLAAPDRDELIDWLRHCPLLHHEPALDFTLLHAGLPPQWTLTEATAHAQEVESVLRSDDHPAFFAHMYGNQPDRWSEELAGMDRLRFITNCFTRLRFVTPDGRLLLKEKGPPGSAQDPQALPWFDHPGRASRGERIVCGHWSTLGYMARHNVWAIDTGCLWGGRLTLLRIDGAEPRPFAHECPGAQDPARFA